MARIKGPRKIHRYSIEFKSKAVSLSNLAGVQVKDVAEALDIHPFMLSRWRKEAGTAGCAERVASSSRAASDARSSSCPPSSASTRCFGRSTSC